jgi:hypothetical protein
VVFSRLPIVISCVIFQSLPRTLARLARSAVLNCAEKKLTEDDEEAEPVELLDDELDTPLLDDELVVEPPPSRTTLSQLSSQSAGADEPPVVVVDVVPAGAAEPPEELLDVDVDQPLDDAPALSLSKPDEPPEEELLDVDVDQPLDEPALSLSKSSQSKFSRDVSSPRPAANPAAAKKASAARLLVTKFDAMRDAQG